MLAFRIRFRKSERYEQSLRENPDNRRLVEGSHYE